MSQTERIDNQYDSERIQELVESLKIAEQQNYSKSLFLSNMSHDIRTPMNAIIGNTSLARASLDNPEKMSRYLDNIENSSKQMLNIVNEILELTRIEVGNISLDESVFSIDKLVDEIESTGYALIHNTNKKFSVKVGKVLHTTVKGDFARIGHVVFNILSNAVKYTPDFGKIDVVIDEYPAHEKNRCIYSILVEDTGIGMSEDYIEHLYEAFVKENRDFDAPDDGPGLGMPIVKSLLNIMGGDIDVKTRLNEGTRVIVTIPLGIRAEDEADESNYFDLDKDIKKLDLSGNRILLVEDNEINAEIVEELLELTAASVERARDGREAVEKVDDSEEGYYDLIFMDIRMPIMNGYEATRAIRKLKRKDAKTLPIIALTANAYSEDAAHAKHVGMNEHISKPIKLDLLAGVLSRYLCEK